MLSCIFGTANVKFILLGKTIWNGDAAQEYGTKFDEAVHEIRDDCRRTEGRKNHVDTFWSRRVEKKPPINEIIDDCTQTLYPDTIIQYNRTYRTMTIRYE